MKRLFKLFNDLKAKIRAYKESAPSMHELIEKHGDFYYRMYVHNSIE